MAELLLELLSEDIPARMQARAAEDLKRLVCDGLKKAGLSFDKAEAFVTPRRLALVVDGLPEKQPDVTEERKGPRVDAPEKAIKGFLKSAGLASLDQCEKRWVGKAEFWYAVIEHTGRPTARVLVDVLQTAIFDMSWPKSMRWADGVMRWVRPLHNILAVFDGKPLQLAIDRQSPETYFDPDEWSVEDTYTNDLKKKLGTLIANDTTVGHRFLAPGRIRVKDFSDYKARLRKARVILDPAKRRRRIEHRARYWAAKEGLTVRLDPELLDEVAGLVEWPYVKMGQIDEAFMSLWDDVLTTVMRRNQKYFSVLKPDGSLAPRFVFVADSVPKDRGKAIVAGNERVLRARLADANFFFERDLSQPLENYVPLLENLVFHARLGSMRDKVRRLDLLAEIVGAYVPGTNPKHVRRAAYLCKADLVTQMVGEFPELQGVIGGRMGGRYAFYGPSHEDAAVATAIAEHYAPQGPNDACPTAPVSVAVALADKFDSLVGFWAIDEKPTGSKDPFALRRAALGVIRLIIENKLRLPLRTVFEQHYETVDSALRQVKFRKDATRRPEEGEHQEFAPPEQPEEFERRKTKVSSELMDFLADRLKVHLKEKGVRHDLISAVFALGGEDDLVRLLARVDALREFLETDDGANLLTAYRRASNIVEKEEKRDDTKYEGADVKLKFPQSEESDLFNKLVEAEKESAEHLANDETTSAMMTLSTLRQPIDTFFDKVTVNIEQPDLRRNRLRLLAKIRETMNQVADFSRIEGESRR